MEKIAIAQKDAAEFLKIDVCDEPWYNFRDYSPMYRMTNENLTKLNEILELEGKDVLTVCGSGDQYLSFVLGGAKDIDVFDINKLTEYYLILKIVAVLVLPLKEYLEYFNGISNTYFLDEDIYMKINSFLPPHVKAFWDFLYSQDSELITKTSSLFFSPKVRCSNVPYLNKNDYKKLQKLLERREFTTFYETDILEILKNIRRKYDIIYSSNIVDYAFKKDKVLKWYLFLKQIEGEILRNGALVASYGFALLDSKYEKYKGLGFDVYFDVYTLENLKIIDEDSVYVYRKK